ncbi:hypothetical protein N177_3607 [Lutibaculum baratangense AMV1]|uniref:Uncharacterized protein n=1 Tax=Lutibaculum baratangense AMV1 TaxID=631454 RepID=V4RDT6_9HYPH|nr:hypothetical protein N177_3607 [Lutibaculum baratangense AMV1]
MAPLVAPGPQVRRPALRRLRLGTAPLLEVGEGVFLDQTSEFGQRIVVRAMRIALVVSPVLA